MRIIVAGSRSFSDYELLKRTLDHLTSKLDKGKLTILSGDAQGADKLGQQWCRERLVRYELYPADWRAHGKDKKAAGDAASKEMIAAADALIVFCGADGRETSFLLDEARRRKLKVRIISGVRGDQKNKTDD